jgi:Rrf2 family protein
MMNISTRGRYAARIMVLLVGSPGEPLTKYQIAKAEHITPAYVQQLMMALRLAGLVHSVRGRLGGFVLARAPEEISVADVLAAVEGEIMPAPCRVATHCERMDACPTKPLWERAASILHELFSGTTIADLAENAAASQTNPDRAATESTPAVPLQSQGVDRDIRQAHSEDPLERTA